MKEEQISSLQLISVRWWNATAYYAVTLAKALQHAGYPVFIGGSAGSPPIIEAEKYQLPVMNTIRLESKSPAEWLRSYQNLKKFISQNSISIMNVHRPEDHLIGALLRRKFPEIPLIRTIGDVRPPKQNPVNRWLHLKATDFFIFSSRANKVRYQRALPIPESRCAVIYAGVDTETFAPTAGKSGLRKQLNIPENVIVFGLVGRFSPVKDHLTFLRAAALLLKESANCRFIISGQEEEISASELREICSKFGIADYVKIIGKQNDVAQVIAALDVGVVTSRGSEAICRIATEYLAMGRPVIVSDVNVLPEMISDGENGFIFPAGSPEQLAGKMKIFLQETDLLRTMGEKARLAAVDRFSLKVFLEKTLGAYLNFKSNIKGEKI